MDSIRVNIEEIEVMILTKDFNETDKDSCNTKNLKDWKACLQNNLNKIIEICGKIADPSKNASIGESEYAALQKNIGDEVVAKSKFFQSIKRLEDKAINKFFDKKIKEAEEVFATTSAQINDELLEHIGELTANIIADEVANISFNTDLIVSTEDAEESQDTTLAGDVGLEPA